MNIYAAKSDFSFQHNLRFKGEKNDNEKMLFNYLINVVNHYKTLYKFTFTLIPRTLCLINFHSGMERMGDLCNSESPNAH